MYLLDIIPAAKLPVADMQLLTYFSKEALPAGALVRVPIGRASDDKRARDRRTACEQRFDKKSSFQMKGIMGISLRAGSNRGQIGAPQLLCAILLRSFPFCERIPSAYLVKKRKRCFR